MRTLASYAATCGWVVGVAATAWTWRIGSARKKKTAPEATDWGLSYTAYCSKYLTPKERKVAYSVIAVSIVLIVAGEAYSR
jgi:hypothetical protein